MESIVFFGSGPVAAASLRLLAEEFNVEAVITKPKPVHHKGDFPVISVARELGLKTLYVRDKQEVDELFATKPAQSRIGVLIDFGIIVSQTVIDYFPLGIVNSHFSLLPEWRGADPITFAILSGQKRTGVSLMLLVEAMDEGPLLAQSPFDLPTDITTPELTSELIELSHRSLTVILPLYIAGKTTPAPQEAVTIAESKDPSYSRKLTKDDGIIDWNKPADQIEREVRAYAEWPKSRTTIGGKEVIILKAQVVEQSGPAGKAEAQGKDLVVFCGQNALKILELKPAGKQKMTGEAFIAGHKQLL